MQFLRSINGFDFLIIVLCAVGWFRASIWKRRAQLAVRTMARVVHDSNRNNGPVNEAEKIIRKCTTS